MKAIKTKFIGPTNTKPSRIKASAEGVTAKIYQAYNFSHEAAALAFCEFHDWGNNLAHGRLDADTWVHCFVPKRAPKLVLGGKAETAHNTAQAKFYTMLHDNGFDALEIHTCRDQDLNEGNTYQLDSDEELLPGDFFTLYGHESGIGLVQIGDFTTFEEACEVAEKLGGVL